MPRLSHRIVAAASFAVLALAHAAPAFADDASDDSALPALPKPDSEAAPPADTVAPKGDTAIVQAKVVQTNHVDTVIVAEPGSNVTVHARSHPDYAPDPSRKAAIIAAPIVFGVGGAVAGIAYLTARGTQSCSYTGENGGVPGCQSDSGTPALWTYNVIVAGVPSVPRWVVGDVMGALIYTGLRTASVVTASAIQWGNDTSSWIGPFMLGFLAPVTLGIVDLATTPHREDLQSRDAHPDAPEAKAQTGFRVSSIAPTTLTDADHKVNGAMVTLGATF